jgi:glucan phosphoethanolaminetransferase (alkaline phosphatase superfamily)
MSRIYTGLLRAFKTAQVYRAAWAVWSFMKSRLQSVRTRVRAPGKMLLLALAAFVLLLLYPNLYLLGEPWNHALPGGRMVGSGRVHVLLVNILLLAMLFAAVRKAWIAVLLLTPFFALLPLELFYMSQFGTPSPAALLGVLADTDRNEAMSWLGQTGLLVLGLSLAAALLAVLLACSLKRAHVAWPPGRVRLLLGVWLPLLIGLPLIGAIVFSGVRDSMRDEQAQLHKALAYRMGGLPRAMLISYPAGVPLRVLDFYNYQRAMAVVRKHVEGMRFGADRPEPLPPQVKREVYVLVIGESLRADHLQTNGYGRQTTPHLQAARNVVSFTDFVSAASVTRHAVPPLFSRRLPEVGGAAIQPEPTVLQAFNEVGFKTYWLTTQAPFGKDDAGISMVLGQAGEVRSVSPEGWRPGVFDGDLLTWVDEVLAKSDEPRQLIVLHTRGSHAQYSLRYPAGFTHFQPAAPAGTEVDPWDASQRASLINAYDNSVRYTDWFVAQVMQRVERATAQHGQGWLMFVSDHGETLFDGQCGRASHGFASRPNFMPAAFVWPTAAYASLHPQTLTALQAHAHKPTDYRSVFHTLLDLADVRVPVYDETFSLGSPRFQPHGARVIDASTGSVIDFDRQLPALDCAAVSPGSPSRAP